MMERDMVDKLILLFIFDKLEVPMQEDIVVEMADANGWIPYIDCKGAFASLVASGFIAVVSQGKAAKRYAITADGRECLSHFYTNIPNSVRESIIEDIKQNRFNYRKKQDYTSDYFRNHDQSYTVVLKIESTSVQLMEIRLVVQDRNTAKWLYKIWPEKASTVYEFIHENLLD